jgi:hypothetical protein
MLVTNSTMGTKIMFNFDEQTYIQTVKPSRAELANIELLMAEAEELGIADDLFSDV